MMDGSDAGGGVPVVHPRVLRVTKSGASDGWCEMLSALQRASFLAVDTEFTGWSTDARLRSKDLEERYSGLRDSVSSRALVEMGVSVFTLEETRVDGDDREGNGKPLHLKEASFSVRTFEFLLCCQNDFRISASSGAFLAKNGFDFSQMFLEGIPYTVASVPVLAKGKSTPRAQPTADKTVLLSEALLSGAENDHGSKTVENGGYVERPKASSEEVAQERKRRKLQRAARKRERTSADNWRALPQGLLWRIGSFQVPLVVHNGLMDLLFLYSAFEAPLPDTLQEFIAAFTALVPTVFDTKTIATTALEEKSSYLGYLFTKCGRRNRNVTASRFSRDRGRGIRCSDGLEGFAADRFSSTAAVVSGEPNEDRSSGASCQLLCHLFATRGFCSKGEACKLSHSIESVLDREEAEEEEALARSSLAPPDEDAEDGDAARNPRRPGQKRMKKARWRSTQRKQSASSAASAAAASAAPSEPNGHEDDAREDDAADRSVPRQRTQHSAGFDAYSTGYVFATFQEAAGSECVAGLKNTLFVSGRREPLLFERSRFTEKTVP